MALTRPVAGSAKGAVDELSRFKAESALLLPSILFSSVFYGIQCSIAGLAVAFVSTLSFWIRVPATHVVATFAVRLGLGSASASHQSDGDDDVEEQSDSAVNQHDELEYHTT